MNPAVGFLAASSRRRAACALAATSAIAACGADGPRRSSEALATSPVEGRSAPLAVVRASDATLRARFGSLGSRFAGTGDGFVVGGGDARGARLGTTANAAWSFSPDANPRHRIALTPLDHANVAASLEDGRVVFRDVAPSTDAAVAAGEGWTELAWVLRDDRAPRVFHFSSSHAMRGEGDGVAIIDNAGRALAHIAAPFAVDAHGKRRAGSLAVKDRVVTIGLDATGLAYPIVLDPYIATATWVKQVLEPTPRTRAMLAPDGSAGAVLFGGGSETANLDDTWAYDGTRWGLQHPAHVPPTSFTSGGEANGHAFMTSFGTNPTWVWNGNDWVSQAPLGVDAFAGIVSVGDTGVAVVADPSGTGSAMAVFDGTSWSTVAAIGASPDTSTYGTLISNGTSAVYFAGNDTWTWSPAANWKLVDHETTAPPWTLARLSGCIGGVPTLVSRESTWTWNGSSWAAHSISGDGPILTGAISTPSSEADVGGNLTELMTDQNGTQRLWSFDGTNWRLANDLTVPSIFLGGFTGFGDQVLYSSGLGFIWTWDGTAWTKNVDADFYLGEVAALAPLGSTAIGIGVNSDSTLTTLAVDATHLNALAPSHPLPWTGDLSTLTFRLSTVGDTTIAAIGEIGTSTTHLAVWQSGDWQILDDLTGFRVDALGGIGNETLILGYDASNIPSGWAYPNGGPIAPFTNVPLPTDTPSGNALIGVGRYALLNTSGAAAGQLLWDGTQWSKAAVSGIPPLGEPQFASTATTAYLVGGYINDITEQNDLYVLSLTLEDGVSCTAPKDCGSGICAQGVCCDRACDGTTESCSLATTVGTCAPILASCTGVATLQGADGTVQSCAPYVCSAAKCLTQCATSTDCVGGFVCDTSSSLCVATSGQASSGGCAMAGASPSGPRWGGFGVAVALIALRRRRAA